MKKFIALMLALMLAMLCVACGGEENPVTTGTNKPNNQTPTTTTTGTPPEQERVVSLEEVMNHPVSPESDFLCAEDENGDLILRKYLGEDDIVVIPETIDGKPIAKIAKFALSHENKIRGIRFSSSIREIDEMAFTHNTYLQCVVFGSGMEVVGQAAFQSCVQLKEVIVNEGLKTIKGYAFSGCTAMKEVTLPDSLETIEMAGFYAMSEGFKMIGKAGSVAESYAAERGYLFEAK